jgi:hypothetical protein
MTQATSGLNRFLDSQPLRKLVVVSAHLWLEHLLLRGLYAVLSNPNALLREKGIGFPLLVSLCEAHGVIDTRLADLLRRVNSLRNKCAHQAQFNPGESDWNALRAALQPFRHHKELQQLDNVSDWDEPLYAIAVLLESHVRAVGATDLDAV